MDLLHSFLFTDYVEICFNALLPYISIHLDSADNMVNFEKTLIQGIR